MPIYLDNQPLDTDVQTVGQAIAAARDSSSAGGRLIVEVRIDGEVLVNESLEAAHDQQVGDRELQLTTAEPKELARQTLLEMREALAATADDQQRAAELLQADQNTGALQHVRQALGVWQQTQQSVLHSAQLLGIRLDDITVRDQPVAQLVAALTDHLMLVRQQLLAGDWLGLADTLSYEMNDAVATWTAVIDALCEKIGD
ncbi:MAG: hypothetical protein ACYC26_03865 [Phycisphaerales bacterium]